MTFNQIATGNFFKCNGNLWCKRSTRTATLWPERPGAGPLGATWSYFRNTDRVNVA